MSTLEKCPKCGATEPVVMQGICGGCGPSSSLPHYDPLSRPEEFIADWDRMIGIIADFADKYVLPKPELVIHPKVQTAMNAVAQQRILGMLIYRGIKVRTGIFELGTILKETR